MVLDNGRFHKAKKLSLPENIVLVFLPTYSPELNPAEKYEQNTNESFLINFIIHLEDVEDFITSAVKKEVMNIRGCAYVFLDRIGSIKQTHLA